MERRLLPQINSKTSGFAYTVIAVALLATTFAVSIIIELVGLKNTEDGYVYLSYLASPVALFAAIAFTMKFRAVSFKTAFPVKCRPKYYLIAFMLVFGLLFSFNRINGWFIDLLKLCGYKQRDAGSYLPNLDGGRVLLALLVIAVIPAFFEEAFFRGVMLNTVEPSVGTIRTVFIIGFAFSLFHGNPEQCIYQFICGCAFAFLAVRAGSVLPAMAMHLLNNATIIIFAACGLLDAAGDLAIPLAAEIVLGIVGGLSLIGGIVWLALDKKPTVKCVKGGIKDFFVFAAGGICVFAMLWLLTLFGVGA